MSQNEAATWLVAYDITDPRRLARVFRYLKKVGVPMQYSLFAVETTAAKMGVLIVDIAKLIDPKTDDVRAYRLPKSGWHCSLGASMLSSDLWIKAK